MRVESMRGLEETLKSQPPGLGSFLRGKEIEVLGIPRGSCIASKRNRAYCDPELHFPTLPPIPPHMQSLIQATLERYRRSRFKTFVNRRIQVTHVLISNIGRKFPWHVYSERFEAFRVHRRRRTEVNARIRRAPGARLESGDNRRGRKLSWH